jgi:hypothetical protein
MRSQSRVKSEGCPNEKLRPTHWRNPPTIDLSYFLTSKLRSLNAQIIPN